MAVTGTVKVAVDLIETQAGDLEAASVRTVREFPWTVASGTGAGQANVLWSDTRTLAASATEDLDLSGTLAGVLTGSKVFAKIKAVIVQAAAANVNDVQVTRKATTGAALFMADGDGIALGPGQVFAWFDPTGAGKTITDTTDDVLTFTNSAGTTGVTYTIIVLGTSA